MIRARTTEGRERAKARGVKMGRPPKLTDHQRREAIKTRDNGDETLAEIGRSYNVSGWPISRLPSSSAYGAESPHRVKLQKHIK
jgi:DNA invertase Pin-like site-specific DNA recombinase